MSMMGARSNYDPKMSERKWVKYNWKRIPTFPHGTCGNPTFRVSGRNIKRINQIETTRYDVCRRQEKNQSHSKHSLKESTKMTQLTGRKKDSLILMNHP